MAKKYDLVVRAEDDIAAFRPNYNPKGSWYRIVKVITNTHQFERGDSYHRRLFHSNQYGTFINGYKVKVHG
jgi:hypothetical protein